MFDPEWKRVEQHSLCVHNNIWHTYCVERINLLAKAKVNLKIHEKHNFISIWFGVFGLVLENWKTKHTYIHINGEHTQTNEEKESSTTKIVESRIFTESIVSLLWSVVLSFFSSFSLRILYYVTMSINFAF